LERKSKEKVMAELQQKLTSANALFLTEYSGMKVAQISKLRRELNGAGGEFKVAKNTLLTKAAVGTQAESLSDQFAGPNAMIYSYKDPVMIAKVLAGVAKEMPKLKVKLGLLGTQHLTPQDIANLATIPPKDVLVAKLLGLMKGMPQRLVGTLSANLMQLMWTLSAIKTQKEEG
jgi:large subunit ribosomal protein L10